MTALVGIEDLGLAMTCDVLLDGFEVEVCVQRVGEPTGEHPAAIQIDDNREIDEAAAHRDSGDVLGPDLVGAFDYQIPEQVRVSNAVQLKLNGINPRGDEFQQPASAPRMRHFRGLSCYLSASMNPP